MTRLFKLAAGRGLTSSRYARLGQAPTGDLQKRRYTNYEDAHAWHFTPSSFALLVLDLSLIGVVDWQVEWMESGKTVEFFGHLRPGARCFQDQRASQAMRLKLLKDMSRELAEQWQSISQADAVPKHMSQKGIARFFNRRSHR